MGELYRIFSPDGHSVGLADSIDQVIDRPQFRPETLPHRLHFRRCRFGRSEVPHLGSQ